MNEEAIKRALFENGMQCFILIGFDMNGEEVRSYHASTTMEEKSLDKAWNDWNEEQFECIFEPDEEFWQDDD